MTVLYRLHLHSILYFTDWKCLYLNCACSMVDVIRSDLQMRKVDLMSSWRIRVSRYSLIQKLLCM